jgi:16S rRNA (guanine527-N7)-methyltransferase
VASSAISNELESGLQQLGLPSEPLDGLLSYLELLKRWNTAYNLTAIRDPGEMVYRHLLDSLSVAPYLPVSARRIIDVGTGAGLPGVPLALLFPEKQFDLLDSNGKKTRFLFQVKTALGLDNMTVLHSRAESWRPQQAYDIVVSRAFASLEDMMESCAHLCKPGGSFLAMKGTRPDAELEGIADRCELRQVHKLHVPGLPEERHLIELGLHQESRTGESIG